MIVELDATQLATPFRAGLPAGGLDQDVPHGLSRRGEEVAAAVPQAARVGADQPQVSLVHEGRRLERLPRRLARQLPRRQATELVIDQREQLLHRPRVAVLDRAQDSLCLVHIGAAACF